MDADPTDAPRATAPHLDASAVPGPGEPPPPWSAPPRANRTAGRILLGLAFLIGVVAIVGMQVTVPYVIISPGCRSL